MVMLAIGHIKASTTKGIVKKSDLITLDTVPISYNKYQILAYDIKMVMPGLK